MSRDWGLVAERVRRRSLEEEARWAENWKKTMGNCLCPLKNKGVGVPGLMLMLVSSTVVSSPDGRRDYVDVCGTYTSNLAPE